QTVTVAAVGAAEVLEVHPRRPLYPRLPRAQGALDGPDVPAGLGGHLLAESLRRQAIVLALVVGYRRPRDHAARRRPRVRPQQRQPDDVGRDDADAAGERPPPADRRVGVEIPEAPGREERD